MVVKKNQIGFSVIETVLVVLVICGLAGAGWLVYQRNDKNSKQASTNQPSDKAAWETYKNIELGYEFSYPETWSESQTSTNTSFTIQYRDNTKNNSDRYVISLGYISEAQLATMGINFCGAYPNDSRCERKQIGNVSAQIDWGSDKTAFASIPRPQGGLVTFTLEPNTTQAKSQFIPIISTFKFTNM